MVILNIFKTQEFLLRYYCIGWAGWAMAGASLISGVLGSNASTSAANTQASAANNATQLQQNMFNTEQANVQPWLQSGNLSLAQLNNFLGQGSTTGTPSSGTVGQSDYVAGTSPTAVASGTNGITAGAGLQPFNPQNLQNTPGYEFQLQQGENALSNNMTQGQGANSGNVLKGLNNYAQGAASTEYQSAYNNYMQQLQQTYSMLSGQSGVGANAALGVAGIGQSTGASIGNNITSAGAAQAAGQVGSANAISGGISNLSNNYLTYQNNQNMQQLLANQNNGNTPAF